LSLERWRDAGKSLEELLRPRTYPLAVKFVRDESDFPEGSRKPEQKLAVCQALAMSRRYGWTIGLAEKDSGCPGASLAYGWTEIYDKGSLAQFFLAAGYAADEEGAKTIVSNIDHLERGKYRGMVISPLTRTKIVPDVILVYGNPAQIMRLIQGAMYKKGERLKCELAGLAASRTGGIIRTFNTDKYNSAGTLSFSPDGKMLAINSWHSRDKNSKISLVDVETGIEIKNIDRRCDCRNDIISFSPDGKFVIIPNANNDFLEFWDVATSKQISNIKADTRINTFTFNPNGRILAIGTDKGIELWNCELKKKIGKFGKGFVHTLAFTSDGKMIVSWGADGFLLWHVDTREIFGQLQKFGPFPSIQCIQFSPNGKLLATGNGGLMLWDPGYYLAILTSDLKPEKEELETTEEFRTRIEKSKQEFKRIKSQARQYLLPKLYPIKIPAQLGQYSADLQTFKVNFLKQELHIKVPRDKAATLIKSRDSNVRFYIEGKIKIVDGEKFKLIQADFVDASTNIRIRIDL